MKLHVNNKIYNLTLKRLDINQDKTILSNNNLKDCVNNIKLYIIDE